MKGKMHEKNLFMMRSKMSKEVCMHENMAEEQ